MKIVIDINEKIYDRLMKTAQLSWPEAEVIIDNIIETSNEFEPHLSEYFSLWQDLKMELFKKSKTCRYEMERDAYINIINIMKYFERRLSK